MKEKLEKGLNRAKLHKEIITDKNGNRKTVWVSNEDVKTPKQKSRPQDENPSKKKSVLDKQKPSKRGGGKSIPNRVEEALKKYPNLSKEEVEKRIQFKVPMEAQNVEWVLSDQLVCKFQDSKNRKQAIYTEKHWEEASKLKFERLTSSAEVLPQIQKDTDKILKSGIVDKQYCIALAVKLMEKAYFRVGNEAYTESYGTYGVTTLRKEHFSVEGSKVKFSYVGKKSVQQNKTINDRKILSYIQKMTNQEGYEYIDNFLSYNDNGVMKPISDVDVRTYLKEYGIKPKDFRTYGANNLFLSFVREMEPTDDKKQRAKNCSKAIESTSKFLGHTPAICKKSYLFKEYIDFYLETGRAI